MRYETILRTALAAVLLLAASAALAEGPEPGDQAPAFTLTDTEGNEHVLTEYLSAGKTVVLEWFNPDCPFIKKHHQHHRTMDETFAAVADQDVVWLAINSSAEGKQGHGLDHNRKAHQEYEMGFPLLLDADGAVGRAYGAKTTPHMFVITADGVVRYNGAIDDDRSPMKLGKTNHVAEALAALQDGAEVPLGKTRPYGCSVKYAD